MLIVKSIAYCWRSCGRRRNDSRPPSASHAVECNCFQLCLLCQIAVFFSPHNTQHKVQKARKRFMNGSRLAITAAGWLVMEYVFFIIRAVSLTRISVNRF